MSKECNIKYQFLYKDKGWIYNYKKNNLFINTNDKKYYKQCPENTGFLAENTHICYNCAELRKNKVGKFVWKMYCKWMYWRNLWW